MAIPNEFKKIIVDMTKDILISFPEQQVNLPADLNNLVFETNPAQLAEDLTQVFTFCKTVYPPRFFEILYQNNEIFSPESAEALYFLPGLDFKQLWNDEQISDKTRETLWKYLQLVLFTIVSGNSDDKAFGDTAKLFENVNEEEFKSKLEETIGQIQTLFTAGAADAADAAANPAAAADAANAAKSTTTINIDDLPDPHDIHKRVSGMMNGKLGMLAREIAEETAAELNINAENATSINDVFKGLFQNPTKLMDIVKNVGSKLDAKMKSGDMKESDMLAEMGDLMKNMKGMPGLGDLSGLLSSMGGGGGMPGMADLLSSMGMNPAKKVNPNAMQQNLDQRLKGVKNRERMLKKLEENKAKRLAAEQQATLLLTQTPAPNKVENMVFSTGEKVERSLREVNEGKKEDKKSRKE